MDEQTLRDLVSRGATIAELSAAAGVDRATIRRRLRKLGIETMRMHTLRTNEELRDQRVQVVQRHCRRHGVTAFRPDAKGTFRCGRCVAERVSEHRRRVKQTLVAEAGGRCILCGYDRCVRALEFHHVDPATKRFGVALHGVARSLERARAEAAKCVLLCSNCHMEVEAGVASVP
jgi:hypothetical protein